MKSYFSETEEFQGPVPAGGYKLRIESIERSKTGPNSQNPGALMYVGSFRIVEPKRHAGAQLRKWFVIGNDDDPKGRQQETWQSELGAKRLWNLLKRAGLAGMASKNTDDEEWMEAAEGREVCAHVLRETRDGQVRNNVDLFFKEDDENYVGTGEALEAPSAERGAKGRAARARKGAGDEPPARASSRRPPDEEEDEAPRARRGKANGADEEPPARRAKDDADDEDDEEKPTKVKARGQKRLPDADEADADED